MNFNREKFCDITNQLLSKGIPLLSVGFKTKVPKHKGWNKADYVLPKTPEELLGSDLTTNVGMLLGERSSKAALDFDGRSGGLELFDKLEVKLRDLNVPMTKTSDGIHAIFKMSDRFKKLSAITTPGLDIKVNGFLMCPPSIHPSGDEYEFITECNLLTHDAPEISDEIVDEIINFYRDVNSQPESGSPPDQSVKSPPFTKGNRNKGMFKYLSRWVKNIGTINDFIEFAREENAKNIPPLPSEELDNMAARIFEHRFKEMILENSFEDRYVMKNGKTFIRRYKDEETATLDLLADFEIRIIELITKSEGSFEEMFYNLEFVYKGGKKGKISVSAKEFFSMGWLSLLGPAGMIAPFQGAREHLRLAILSHSKDYLQEKQYQSLGWEKCGEDYIFIHAGGYIGECDNNSKLTISSKESGLEKFSFPDPVNTSGDIFDSYAWFLYLKRISENPMVKYTLLAATCMAPLSHFITSDFSIALVGSSGTRKTATAAILQSFFGRGFKGKEILESFESTSNAISRKLYLAQSLLGTIDDYVSGLSNEKMAHSIHRIIGNQAGRSRMRSDGYSLRDPYYPRGLVLSTAEDLPSSQSMRARMVILEFNHSTVDINYLTELQKAAREGELCQAMSNYIYWISQNINEVRSIIENDYPVFLAQLTDPRLHGRTPSNLAKLLTCLKVFYTFGLSSGEIGETEVRSGIQEALIAFQQLAYGQNYFTKEDEPSEIFLSNLGDGFSSSKCHLIYRKNLDVLSSVCLPPEPSKWGYKRNMNGEWSPGGECIGWFDDGMIYLIPSASYAFARRSSFYLNKPLHTSASTLWRELGEKKLIVTGEAGRNVVRRQLGQNKERCIQVPLEVMEQFLATPENSQTSQVQLGLNQNGGQNELRV